MTSSLFFQARDQKACSVPWMSAGWDSKQVQKLPHSLPISSSICWPFCPPATPHSSRYFHQNSDPLSLLPVTQLFNQHFHPTPKIQIIHEVIILLSTTAATSLPFVFHPEKKKAQFLRCSELSSLAHLTAPRISYLLDQRN